MPLVSEGSILLLLHLARVFGRSKGYQSVVTRF